MDTPIKVKPVADLRDYLAEERTFLAWIRTGIALMGFGFVMARFGIFGDELHMMQQTPAGQPHAVGGVLHVIVNNQIGFTTPPNEGVPTWCYKEFSFAGIADLQSSYRRSKR